MNELIIMPVWSDKCIDTSAGFDLEPIIETYYDWHDKEYKEKTILLAHPKKLGCYVLTLEECDEYLNKRE